jgi:tetratricopeptide (TPR) repeat protein
MALEMDDQIGPVYGNLATVYNSVGQDELAVSILTDWILAQPGNARANYLRGLILYETDYVDLAESDFRKAIEKNPEFYRAYYNLATLLYYEKRYDEAHEIITEGLKINPDDEEGLNLLLLTQKI